MDPLKRVRREVWDSLEATPGRWSAAWWLQLGIIVLIVANVVAAIVGTVEAVDAWFGWHLAWFERFSVAVFTAEFAARFWSCTASPIYSDPVRGRARFLRSPGAVIDVLAIAPFYLAFFTADLRMLRMLRLARVLRIAKLARYTRAMRIMRKVLVQQREELAITLVFMGFLAVIAASLMYFAEHEHQPEFYSDIPSALWWSVVTLTTVGYGDVYPVTPLGKVIATCIAVLGVGLFALPAGILGSGFMQQLQEEKRRESQSDRCPHCGEPLHTQERGPEE